MTFTRVGIIVVITAVAVYFGLNLLLPHNTAEQKAAGGTTPDQVFSTTADATPAPAATPPADQEAPAAATAGAAVPPPAGSTETAATAAAAPAAPAQGLSEEEARKIAEEVGRKVATQVASSVVQSNQPAQPATDTAPATTDTAAAGSSSSGSADQAPAAAPAAEPAAAAAPAEAPAPAATAEAAPAEAAPAPAPKKSKHTSAAAPAATASSNAAPTPAKATAKSRPGEQSTDAITTWWPALDKQKDSQLNLVYAGEAASEKAAVLLFSDNIGNVSAAASHIQILDSSGKPAAGHWEVSPQNARMLLFKTKPGRYTLILAPELAGLSGKTLGTGLHGPVYVH
ncbi:hypothetical protein [Nevskia soli]|uniref:hypothetical protein n=1 Tax=Nevskia soli TaxID=418856 RepID=UPI00068D8CC8|nr:hypothetical protein [Nevskia soli]